MKKIFKLLSWLIFFVLISICIGSIITLLPLPNKYRVFIVQTGSMEPTIKTGSLIICQEQKKYSKGDIVTFKYTARADLKNPNMYITHRIVDIVKGQHEQLFITKGDKNKAPDMVLRPSALALGKLKFSIPYLGYPIGFAKTQTGFIILVVIPATIIIYSEIINIKNEALKLIKKRKKRKLTMKEKVEKKIGEEIIAVEKEVKKDVQKIFGKKRHYEK